VPEHSGQPHQPLPRTGTAHCAAAASSVWVSAASAMWWPAWRARNTTLSSDATTAGAGARSSSKAVSSTRSRHLPVRPGRGVRGRRCSERLEMHCENLRARIQRRAIGVSRTTLPNNPRSAGTNPARKPLSKCGHFRSWPRSATQCQTGNLRKSHTSLMHVAVKIQTGRGRARALLAAPWPRCCDANAKSRACRSTTSDSRVGVTWLEPTLRVEVTYSELMEGRLRDPVYRGVV
jgi:hypothetical protein